MPVTELYPPDTNTNVPPGDPVIFLAGPIQGGGNWQAAASHHLEAAWTLNDKGLWIANPRRPRKVENFVYSEQVQWEKAHLKRAAEHGAIIFWFAKQDPDEPYEQGRPYAKTTFGELNRIIGWLDYDPDIPVVIGQEFGYTGTSDSYVAELIAEKQLPVYDDLAAVAVALARS